MKWYRIILWYLRPRVIKNYFKYIVLNRQIKESSITNTNFKTQTTGITDVNWYNNQKEE